MNLAMRLFLVFCSIFFGVATAGDGAICVSGSTTQNVQFPFTGRYYISEGRGVSRAVTGETCLNLNGLSICYPVAGTLLLSGNNLELSMAGTEYLEVGAIPSKIAFNVSTSVSLNAGSLSGKATSLGSFSSVTPGAVATSYTFVENVAVTKCPPVAAGQIQSLNKAIKLAKIISR